MIPKSPFRGGREICWKQDVFQVDTLMQLRGVHELFSSFEVCLPVVWPSVSGLTARSDFHHCRFLWALSWCTW
jgi:hypothetical protein